jgi:hypothetical protein
MLPLTAAAPVQLGTALVESTLWYLVALPPLPLLLASVGIVLMMIVLCASAPIRPMTLQHCNGVASY